MNCKIGVTINVEDTGNVVVAAPKRDKADGLAMLKYRLNRIQTFPGFDYLFATSNARLVLNALSIRLVNKYRQVYE